LRARETKLQVSLDVSGEFQPRIIPRRCRQGDRSETKAEIIQRVFCELRQLRNVTVALENAKTYDPEDMKLILESIRQGRGANDPSSFQAQNNIRRANQSVAMGIQRAISPEMERLKADHLFFLLPTLSFERLVLNLIFYCFGWTGSSFNPFTEGSSFHPSFHPCSYPPASNTGGLQQQSMRIMDSAC